VAIFGVASRVAGLVGFVVAAVSTMAGPMFTELHGQGRSDALRDLVVSAGRWMLWPSVAAAAILIVFGPWVLGLFGSEFVAGTQVLWILLGAQIVHAAAGPVFVLITFTGFHHQSARIYGYMLLLNVLLNVVGIHLFGLYGAAAAALVTAIVWSVMLHRAVSSNLKLHASPLVQWVLRNGPDE
jgi:O-antigen/teichoic acid export membrane protein